MWTRINEKKGGTKVPVAPRVEGVAIAITWPRGAAVTPTTPIFYLYYPDVLCINTAMEVDIISDNESTVQGKEPPRPTCGIATTTSNVTMSPWE
jgi:hypothetical protein